MGKHKDQCSCSPAAVWGRLVSLEENIQGPGARKADLVSLENEIMYLRRKNKFNFTITMLTSSVLVWYISMYMQKSNFIFYIDT